MNLLAIETATAACSVALKVGDRWVDRHRAGPRVHAEVLVPWISELLAEAGLTYSDLDAIAVDRGPGGFTSLRLGLGVAQGIALAHDLPCRPVSSLAVLATAARPGGYSGPMLAAIDARMGELYAAWFEFDADGFPVPLGREMLLAPEALNAGDRAGFIAAGNALAVHGKALAGLLAGANATYPDAWPTARAVAALAGRVEAVPAHRLEPVYLRDDVTG